MARLIFDIETAGEDFDSFDEVTQKMLTRTIDKDALSSEEYERAIDKVRNDVVFSPLTGKIVAIGVFDESRDKSVVYFQAPGEKLGEVEEGNTTYKQMSEKEMLESFWRGANEYDEFISFNGRGFDVPYLMLRSAIANVKPTKDLMRGRYLYQQDRNAVHIDLFDQLSFYGAVYSKGRSLHMYCRAFGIDSPKEGGVSGDNVTELFNDGKYMDIARYNMRDLVSTKELFEYWNSYLRF